MSRRSSMSTIEALRIADFSVFGYSIDESSFGFSVGPKGLSRKGAEKLASEVAEAVHMLNRLLSEESGVSLGFIEFDIVGTEKGNLPEAMALVTGGDEESSNFIVLLEHEKGLVDVFKVMELAGELSSRLKDIRLACTASKLSSQDTKLVMQSFVERFTRRIYGEASQKKYREKYARDLLAHLKILSGLIVEGPIEVNYGVKPLGFNASVKKISFEKQNVSKDFEYLKSLIFTKTALEVLINDVGLIGREILSLINDYTVNEIGENIALRLAETLWERITPGLIDVKNILEDCDLLMDEAKASFNLLKEKLNSLLQAGEKDLLRNHLDRIDVEGLAKKFKDVLANFLFNERTPEEEIWSWDLKDEVSYFLEQAEKGLSFFERAISSFVFMQIETIVARRLLEDFVRNIVDPIRRKVVEAYINKVKEKLESWFENRSPEIPLNWDFNIFRSRLKDDLISQLEGDEDLFSIPEILEIAFNVTLAEITPETRNIVKDVYQEVREHVSEVVPGLSDYLLSHNVLGAFLEHNPDITSPQVFSEKFFSFILRDVKEFPKWERLAKSWLELFALTFKGKPDICSLVAEFVDFINRVRDEESSKDKPKEILETKLRDHQQEIDSLLSSLSELMEKRNGIERQIDVVQSQLDSTENFEIRLKTDYSVKVSTLKQLRERLEKKKDLLEKISQTLASAREEDKPPLLEQKNNLEAELQTTTLEVQKIISEIERIDRALGEAIEAKERFKNALKQLHLDLEKISDEISKLNDEIRWKEEIKSALTKFLENYSHTSEETLFLPHIVKTELQPFIREKLVSEVPHIAIEGLFDEFKTYMERIFLKAFSYILLRPARLLLRSESQPKLNYLVLYEYPDPKTVRMIIGNNLLDLKLSETEGE
ncbi:MAG: hypothetical protein ACTSXC_01755 [Candidatus Freyarchaeota archaeon]|nr:hypothetical protein [Candidatus Freyrarchaeum guaymaensis]